MSSFCRLEFLLLSLWLDLLRGLGGSAWVWVVSFGWSGLVICLLVWASGSVFVLSLLCEGLVWVVVSAGYSLFAVALLVEYVGYCSPRSVIVCLLFFISVDMCILMLCFSSISFCMRPGRTMMCLVYSDLVLHLTYGFGVFCLLVLVFGAWSATFCNSVCFA